MLRVRVAAAALNQTPLDWEGNFNNIILAINQAITKKVSILCLPELCITGYGCEDAFLAPFVLKAAQISLRKIVNYLAGQEHKIAVSVGLPVMIGGSVFNCAVLIVNGNVAGCVPKQHLAGDGIHYEPRWFKPWPIDAESTSLDDEVPTGNLLFSLGYKDPIKIGFEICEDAWVVDRPGIGLSRRGADIILNPSASHFAFGKHEIRKRFVCEGSRSQNVTYVYSNLLGNESGRVIFDGDTIIASGGDVIATGGRFSFDDVVLTTAVVDIDKTRLSRAKLVSASPMLDAPGAIYASAVHSLLNPVTKEDYDGQAVDVNVNKYDEFTNAATLGLFDYMRKSHAKGYMLSLSGGADSSACAALVRLMHDRGVASLGLKKFNIKSGLNVDLSKQNLMHQLLTCVYQSTSNSSIDTLESAGELASCIEAEFINWNVDDVVKSYTEKASSALGRELSWETDDITLQNIQARARAPGIWMLANATGKLLISTSNRSEAAVGYATMDGDTCGGLSPIAGIDKNFLLNWLQNAYEVYSHDGQRATRLFGLRRVVTDLTPTAELRPGQKQTDEDDLMPYDVLDMIERLAIRDKKSPEEVYTLLKEHFYTALKPYANSKLKDWVRKFFLLWCRNQWKRERYAVSFHYDDENLDPKTWCRWPVLSSGLAKELNDLAQMI